MVLFAISFESIKAQSSSDSRLVNAVRVTLRSPTLCRRRYSASTCRTAALIIRLVRQAGSATGAELLLGDEEEEAGDEEVGQCNCWLFQTRESCINLRPSTFCQRICCRRRPRPTFPETFSDPFVFPG